MAYGRIGPAGSYTRHQWRGISRTDVAFSDATLPPWIITGIRRDAVVAWRIGNLVDPAYQEDEAPHKQSGSSSEKNDLDKIVETFRVQRSE